MTYEEYATLRNNHDLTDYQVAKMTGVPRSCLSQWKTGKHVLSERHVERIEKLFSETPESNPVFPKLINAMPITSYQVDLGGGSYVSLDEQQYDELHTAVIAFVNSWVNQRIFENKGQKEKR